MSDNLKAKTIKGAVWTGVERLGYYGIGFVVSVVLARLLSPSDYGIIGMLTVFIAISQLFIDCGFSSALIRKKDRTEQDFSTVFWCNLGISLVCYAMLFIAAPAIARFYHMPVLSRFLRVLGLSLVLNALYTIQVTRLTALVDFKTQAKVTLANCVLGGAFGITLAYLGCGAWALVGQTLFGSCFCGIVYWFITGWRPRFLFSRQSFKELFGFGSKIMASSFLSVAYVNLSPLIIGRKYTAAALGFYTRADSLAALPGNVFQSTLGRVIFPVLSSIQDDEERLRGAYNKYLRLITSLVAPAMLLFAAVSKPLVSLLIGDKWLPCVPYLQLLAIAWMIDPIIQVNLNMLYVKGRSDVVLKLEVIKKTIAIIIVLVAVQYGVLWLCVGRVIYGYIALALNIHYCGPFIGMGFWRQIREVLPAYLAAILAGGAAYFVVSIGEAVEVMTIGFLNHLLTTCLAVLIAVVVYAAIGALMKFDLFTEMMSVKKRLKK